MEARMPTPYNPQAQVAPVSGYTNATYQSPLARMYQLDMAFCPLCGQQAVIAHRAPQRQRSTNRKWEFHCRTCGSQGSIYEGAQLKGEYIQKLAELAQAEKAAWDKEMDKMTGGKPPVDWEKEMAKWTTKGADNGTGSSRPEKPGKDTGLPWDTGDTASGDGKQATHDEPRTIWG